MALKFWGRGKLVSKMCEGFLDKDGQMAWNLNMELQVPNAIIFKGKNLYIDWNKIYWGHKDADTKIKEIIKTWR